MEIRKLSKQEHEDILDEMEQYMEPIKVGIFWYDFVGEQLLYPISISVSELNWPKNTTIPKLHQDIWKKLHYRAVAKKDKNSIAYKEQNYTLIPRGRIFVKDLMNNKYVVRVGNWINEGFTYKDKHFDIDVEIVRALIIEEFNLPDDFEFEIDEHWNIGKGWSERDFK